MEPRTRRGERGCAAAEHPATPQPRNPATSESGFTLAAVLVMLTVIMVFVAYTVPRQWSAIMQRERERQTIYIMQQYARACLEFQRKHQTYPVSPNQLKEARSPRIIRGLEGEFVDPLTGEVDWLVIPQAQAAAAGSGQPPPGVVPGTGANPNNPNAPPTAPGIPLKDYAGGPFVGVRPPLTGKSMLSPVKGQETYETWSYTALDLQRDLQLKLAGLATPWK